jgi:hypothetical protein
MKQTSAVEWLYNSIVEIKTDNSNLEALYLNSLVKEQELILSILKEYDDYANDGGFLTAEDFFIHTYLK